MKKSVNATIDTLIRWKSIYSLIGYTEDLEIINSTIDILKNYDIKEMEYEKIEIENELRQEVESLCSKDIDEALRIKAKQERYQRLDEIKEAILNKYKEENKDLEELDVLLYKVSKIISDVEYNLFRKIK